MNVVPASENKPQIPWFILFYDLVIVASFSQVSHVYGAEPTWANFLYVAGCVLFLFALWGVTTLELLLSDTWPRRVLALFQVTALVVAALAMGHGKSLEGPWGFAALSVAVGTTAILTGLRAQGARDGRRETILSLGLAASSIIFLVTAFEPRETWKAGALIGEGSFFAGTVVLVAVAALHAPRVILDRTHIKEHDIQERLGLILLIVLGESFLMLLGAVGENSSVAHPWFLVATVLVVFAVWLLYFPGLAHAPIPTTRRGIRARMIAHYLLILTSVDAIVACASIAKDSANYDEALGIQESWTALPFVAMLGAVIWIMLLRDRKWSLEATLHAVTAVVVAAAALAGMLVPYPEANVILLGAIGVLLADAVASVALRRRVARVTTSS